MHGIFLITDSGRRFQKKRGLRHLFCRINGAVPPCDVGGRISGVSLRFESQNSESKYEK